MESREEEGARSGSQEVGGSLDFIHKGLSSKKRDSL
jgi:hypothetical protein